MTEGQVRQQVGDGVGVKREQEAGGGAQEKAKRYDRRDHPQGSILPGEGSHANLADDRGQKRARQHRRQGAGKHAPARGHSSPGNGQGDECSHGAISPCAKLSTRPLRLTRLKPSPRRP